MNETMVEVKSEEVAHVSDGVLPLIPIAVAFGKGAAWGVRAAATAHVGLQLYDLMMQ